MTKQEKMVVWGLTDDDMNAEPETLSLSLLLARFYVEFDARPLRCCCATGKPGHFDGKNFRYRPDNLTDEDEIALIKESLRQKKNLFVEQWTNIAKYLDNVDY